MLPRIFIQDQDFKIHQTSPDDPNYDYAYIGGDAFQAFDLLAGA